MAAQQHDRGDEEDREGKPGDTGGAGRLEAALALDGGGVEVEVDTGDRRVRAAPPPPPDQVRSRRAGSPARGEARERASADDLVMTIGAALLTIAVGAVLAFAVTAQVAGIDLQTVGYILLVIGVLGLLLGLWMMSAGRRRGDPPPPGY
jgi:hypothetical protein